MSLDFWLGAVISAVCLYFVYKNKTPPKLFELMRFPPHKLSTPGKAVTCAGEGLSIKNIPDTGKRRAKIGAVAASAKAVYGVSTRYGALILLRGEEYDTELCLRLEQVIINYCLQKEGCFA